MGIAKWRTVASAALMERFLGASSPKVTWIKVMILNPTMMEREERRAGESTPRKAKRGRKRRATAGSPSQPRPRLARVMPNWQTER
jgi:hypothetical protein